MTRSRDTVRVSKMAGQGVADPIGSIMLQEFRLRAAASAGAVARIVAGFAPDAGPAVPLLTSISDPCDVAVVRATGPDRSVEEPARRALEGLVASWQPPRRFTPRITERSGAAPSYYRLAVTASGINTDRSPAQRSADRSGESSTTPVDLLWIGTPVGSAVGLLVLVGSDEDAQTQRPDPHDWPLPLTTALGVRIYASR